MKTCKVRGDPRAQGKVGEGSPRRPSGRAGRARPADGGGDREEQSTRRPAGQRAGGGEGCENPEQDHEDLSRNTASQRRGSW